MSLWLHERWFCIGLILCQVYLIVMKIFKSEIEIYSSIIFWSRIRTIKGLVFYTVMLDLDTFFDWQQVRSGVCTCHSFFERSWSQTCCLPWHVTLFNFVPLELCDISSVLLYKLSCAFYAGSVNSSRFSTIMEQNKQQGITTVFTY